MQVIVFSLSDKYYGITTDKVEEISKKIISTRVPNSPDWVEGLINLRGNVVTLVNLCKLLRQSDNECYNNIIIIHDGEEMVGLMVKEVIEVIDIENTDIQKINDGVIDGILGIIQMDDEIVNIIDIEMVLSKNEGYI